jgi:hypothetical protein
MLASQVMLESTGILSGLRQFVATVVALHIWMNAEWQLRHLPCPADDFRKTSGEC